MKVLRVGVIGNGRQGHRHARVLESIDGVKLVAIVDPKYSSVFASDISSSQRVATVRSIENLIDIGVDYCVVAVPPLAQTAIAQTLAEAGIPALLEKPLGVDLASSLATTEAFESRGLVAAINFIERFNPDLLKLRRDVESGALGKIEAITTVRTSSSDKPPHIETILDLGIHDFDITMWITGFSYTSVETSVTSIRDRPFDNGVLINGIVNNEIPVRHRVGYSSTPVERYIEIVASKYTVKISLVFDPTIHRPEPLELLHQAFRNKILGQEVLIPQLKEAIKSMIVTEAAIKSREDGIACSL